MNLPIILLPEARDEFDAAADWYEQKRVGLGVAFVARVQESLERISRMPNIRAPLFQSIRRDLVQQFPYSVYYRMEPGQVVVISVFHNKRDPTIWQTR